jgi:DNA-binding SARP family transcriptional activator
MDVDFRMLGPLEVRLGDVPLDVGTPKQRTVMALLLLHANQPVTTRRVVDELWPDGAPNSAVANVTTYLSRLRRTLAAAGGSLERRDAGYLLRARPGSIDQHRFADHARRGEAAWSSGETAAAARHWESALATWRGLAFEGLPTGPELDAARAEWGERRLTVLEQHARARLRLGRYADAVADLRRHTLAEPFRESGWLLLMAALRLAGNPAAALEAYEQARAVLAEQLGVDPGTRLRGMHHAVLADDSDAAWALLDGVVTAPGRNTAPGPEPKAPAQLPLDVHGFTGRTDQLAHLDAILTRAASQPTAVIISAVSGMAGVGKTALALHWAHRRSDRFPDGQLYVNLRGFDPAGSILSPAKAVRGFLDALGVSAERIPVDLDAQAALYRSLMAGRRMLVVLDNARDADQVRVLLPGSPGCLVVVTSRNRLSGLVALEGAQPLILDLLDRDEARQLLARRLGDDRVAAEPEAADEIITRCAQLPLALAVVAARAATHPQFSLDMLAGQLREARGSLDAFSDEGSATDLRAVFSWSYQELGPAAARLFRLLGLHPGADISALAAASLAGAPPSEVRLLLAELTRANLLTEQIPGRYTFHDLLRAYATELTQAHDTGVEGRTALHRLLDHYLHTAHAAATLLVPHRDPITLDPPSSGAIPQDLTTHEQALAWLAAERSALVAAIEQAAASDFNRHTWQLAWALTAYFARQGHCHEWAATQHAALRAAIRVDDLAGQADAHRALLRAYGRLGQETDAHKHFQRALELFAELDDAAGQAHTHLNFAHSLIPRGRHHEALHHNQQALDLYRAAGHLLGQAEALNSVGWTYGLLGNHQQTLDHCQQALILLRQAGASARESNTLDSMGYAHHHLGNHRQAVACYHQALGLVRESGDRYNEADILTHLGDTLHTAGDPDAARESWQQALTILDEIDHPDAGAVRTKLHNLTRPAREAG